MPEKHNIWWLRMSEKRKDVFHWLSRVTAEIHLNWAFYGAIDIYSENYITLLFFKDDKIEPKKYTQRKQIPEYYESVVDCTAADDACSGGSDDSRSGMSTRPRSGTRHGKDGGGNNENENVSIHKNLTTLLLSWKM